MINHPDPDRWHHAIRAAGHAIIGRVLDIRTGSVSIGEPSKLAALYDDFLLIDHRWSDRQRQRPSSVYVYGRILVLMAGKEAEFALLGSSRSDDERFERRIWEEVSMLTDHAPDMLKLEKRMRRMTKTIVRRHADKIERLALALFVQGEIEADDEVRTKAGLPPAPPYDKPSLEELRPKPVSIPIDDDPLPRVLH